MVAQVGFEPPTFRSCVQRGGKDDVIIMGLLCRGWIFRGFEGFCPLVSEDFKSVIFALNPLNLSTTIVRKPFPKRHDG